ncbi:MAG: hypothetical protein M0Z75_01740 [Nitrospiraceae bacterium]|nr:hypothetical protein [Nitrospiraceae bacterium]
MTGKFLLPGKFLAVAAWAAYTIFFVRVVAHVALWFKRPWRGAAAGMPPEDVKLKLPVLPVIAPAALEALFLRRLLKANPVLWIGEWVFHMSFVLVLLRHLRYFLTPVPEFIWRMQLPGRIAGYIMPFSLLYIIIVKAVAGKSRYAFGYNYFLLVTLLLISGLGVLMSTVFHPNIVAVKEYMMSALRLKAAASVAAAWSLPGGLPFLAHFTLALVLLVYLPTHIFAAPFTLYEAKKREKTLGRILHD